MRPGPKINHVVTKYCRHTVKVKTNSLYHRPKQSSNKIQILHTKFESKKGFNLPKLHHLQSLRWQAGAACQRSVVIYLQTMSCSSFHDCFVYVLHQPTRFSISCSQFSCSPPCLSVNALTTHNEAQPLQVQNP